MTKDYYYLYEILLSLRLEYLKNRAELNKLKQYIICDDKRITDFYFWLFKEPNKEISVWINTKEKKEWLNYLRMLLGTYVIGLDDNLLKRKNDSLELVSNKFNIKLNPDYIEELNNEIEKIIATDFVQKMPFSVSDNAKKITLSLNRFSFQKSKFNFYYYCSAEEGIYINNHYKKERITDEFIWNILNEKILKRNFSEYHQSIIENSCNQKEIKILDEFYDKKCSEVELKDEKYIILSKKKRLILSK